MEDFKRIILSANILNNPVLQATSRHGGSLEFIPNVISADDLPTDFSIEFISEDRENKKNYVFKYNLSVQLGKFAKPDYQRKILLEELFIGGKEIFTRKENKIELNFNKLKRFLPYSFKKTESKNIMKRLNENLVQTDLFLTSGFKNICSSQLVEIFKNWFLNNFKIICNANKVEVFPPVSVLKEAKDRKFVKNSVLDKILKKLGIVSDVGYGFNKFKNYCELASLIKNDNNSTNVIVPSRIFESLGTLRLSSLIIILYNAIKSGLTIVMDEFDASIHPMIIMNIINLFHNDEINKNHAQLIFSTHNPIFLKSSLFRRDEIKFVDKEENSNTSILYALSDFGTNSRKPVRKTTDYMKNYFINRYGAVRDVNLSDVFKEYYR
jgi:AAA15 family ATPase/GTPase